MNICGGGEKAPAAMSRNCKYIIKETNNIEFGEMKQTRSFLYVDDCIEVIKLFNSKFRNLNIGSDEQVSINQFIKILKKFKIKKINIKYNLNKPLG